MTDYKASGSGQLLTSVEVSPSTIIEMLDLPHGLTHTFVGIQMLDEAGALIVATAGTVLVEMQTINTRKYEPISDGPTIDATAPTTSSSGAPITAVRLTPTGIAGITTYKAVFSHYRS